MKKKEHLAITAIFAGTLFTAYAANTMKQNEQQTTKIKKSARKISTLR